MANLLPLETWRQIMGFHPYHFWQLADDSLVPVQSTCMNLVREYAWQAEDRVGRAEIRRAIEDAEELLASYLRYYPAPRYLEETVAWPEHYAPDVIDASWSNSRWQWKSVQMSRGYVQAVGVETYTHLGSAAVNLSDGDGDGLLDTFTATFSGVATEHSVAELGVYFPAGERLEQGVSEDWRVSPVRITKQGAGPWNYVVKGRSWLLVRPVLYQGWKSDQDAARIDPTNPTNYVSQLELHRRYTSAGGTDVSSSQAVLIWETQPDCFATVFCDRTSGSTDPATIAQAVGRVGIRDARLGIVTPAESVYDPATGKWSPPDCLGGCQPPARVKVRYLAGLPLEEAPPGSGSYHMPRWWQTIVARLAAAELAKPICGCESANHEIARWQFDMSRAAGANDEQYSISAEDLANPFGQRRGHVWAWRQVRNLRLMPGVAI